MQIKMLVLMTVLTALPLTAISKEALVMLQELESEVLKNNPEILMVEKKVESATEKQSLASALPDPMIGYMVQNEGSPLTWTVGSAQMSMQGVVFSQEIPFPGKLGTKGHAAVLEAEAEQERARETRLRVLRSLRTAYYEYYYAYRSAEILDETKELMKNVQRIAETKYATGQGTQQDVVRAQLEVSMLLDRIAEAELNKEKQASVINALAGRDPLAPLGRPDNLPRQTPVISVEEMASHALSYAPALREKQRVVEQSREELSLSRREYLPDMVVSGGWFKRGQLSDVWQATVMFKVPLYFWNKSTAVNASSADLSAARYEYDAERLATLARVKDLYSSVKTSEHHIDLYEAGIIPQAKLSFQAATSNYQVGKTDFMSLLERD